MQLEGPALQGRHGHVGEGDEVALARVQHVRDAAAESVASQREHTLYAEPIGLYPDPLLAVVHARVIALESCFGIAHPFIIG